MLNIGNIESVDQLVQILNSKEQLLHAAHDPESTVDYEWELLQLQYFREDMLEKTEYLLANCVQFPTNMDKITRKLDQEIKHSLGTCLSRCNPYTTESNKLTEADAYKMRFLLDYIAFLQDYNGLLIRYLEYAMGYAEKHGTYAPFAADPDPGAAVLEATSVGNPEVKQLNQGNASEDQDNGELKNFEEKILEGEKPEKTKKAFLIAVVILIMEQGWEKFLKPLTIDGRNLLFAKLLSCSIRYFGGNMNNENEKLFPWKKYLPEAREFLDELPRFKGN